MPIIDFDAVTRRFAARNAAIQAVTALDNVTLEIQKGEIFGVVGESGAGKSTFLQALGGLVIPDSGALTVDGVRIVQGATASLRALRRRIGIVFQGVHLLSNITVGDNVGLPLKLRTERPSRRERRRLVSEILDFVGLAGRERHFPAQLSGGEQQRVAIARALISRPSILLCDEPTSALDVKTTAEILRLLRAARDEFGTTVVVISHDLDVVKALCERVAFLDHGALREVFTVRRSTYEALPSYEEQVRAEFGE